jgi:hypothetical protein
VDLPAGEASYRVEGLALTLWGFIGQPALHIQARVGASINESGHALFRKTDGVLSLSLVKTPWRPSCAHAKFGAPTLLPSCEARAPEGYIAPIA